MLKKLLSYFVPVKIHQSKSRWSRSLEIAWNNGELVMDSAHTNYSYGSLQRILRKGLKAIGFEKVSQMRQILVLGVAGGSVIKTLTEEIGFKGKITGVDIDAEVIALANRYFGLDQIPSLDIVIDDAFEYMLKTQEKYDLIIVDIFQDTKMPNFLFEPFFAKRLRYLLHPGGIVLFNTMLLNQKDNDRNKAYLATLGALGFQYRTIPRVEQHNELILFEN